MENVPKHIGIIMDGNRRWARAHGLPTFEGHRRGYNKVKDVAEWCAKRGVEVVTVFAFSTENWKRSEEEVSYLMDLLRLMLKKEVDEFVRRGIRIRIIGRREGLAEDIVAAAHDVWERTKNNSGILLQGAINYGGHAEIVDAAKKIIEKGMKLEDITEEVFEKYIYASDVPAPELIIRTSGEQRLSGFLTWQSSYSELYFINNYWPDFSEEDLDEALTWFANRCRRFGGDKI